MMKNETETKNANTSPGRMTTEHSDHIAHDWRTCITCQQLVAGYRLKVALQRLRGAQNLNRAQKRKGGCLR